MRVAITGATGLIGSALAAALRERGDEAIVVSRSARPGTSAIAWDPTQGFRPRDVLAGVDAVVNLAGESIAGRWTAGKKARIRDSRLHATKSVVDGIAAAGERDPSQRPRVLINASGIGVFGDRGDELLDDASAPGDDFLADVCRGWETAAREVEALTGPPVRLCIARFGMVLDAHAGALAELLTPFRLGLGGPIASGQQWMAWIHRRDAIEALLFMLDHAEAQGAYNVVAPNPVRNREFVEALAGALRRPAFVRVPKLGIKLALGEMGEALLLSGQRAVPTRLREAGFEFGFPELGPALAQLLG